jgi:hypothetical protein
MSPGITPINTSYQHYNNTPFVLSDAALQGAVREVTAAGVREKSITDLANCVTCSNRTYQDKSSDGGVSMQSPTQLSPEQAASAVPAHEAEHAARDAAQAKSEGREVISNTIRIFTSTCPECGKTFVSGGESRTVTGKREDEPQMGALHQPQQILDILM